MVEVTDATLQALAMVQADLDACGLSRYQMKLTVCGQDGNVNR